MISYTTDKGCLVFHYNPHTDNYDEAETQARIKHGLVGARITTIAVTPETDFLKKEKRKWITL